MTIVCLDCGNPATAHNRCSNCYDKYTRHLRRTGIRAGEAELARLAGLGLKPRPPATRGDQPCKEDPELHFSTDPGAQSEAKKVCNTCPYLGACAAYALTHHVEGVWGGTSDAERREWRKTNGVDAIPLGGWYAPRNYATASSSPSPCSPS